MGTPATWTQVLVQIQAQEQVQFSPSCVLFLEEEGQRNTLKTVEYLYLKILLLFKAQINFTLPSMNFISMTWSKDSLPWKCVGCLKQTLGRSIVLWTVWVLTLIILLANQVNMTHSGSTLGPSTESERTRGRMCTLLRFWIKKGKVAFIYDLLSGCTFRILYSLNPWNTSPLRIQAMAYCGHFPAHHLVQQAA